MRDLVENILNLAAFWPWRTSGMSVDECSGSFFITCYQVKFIGDNKL